MMVLVSVALLLMSVLLVRVVNALSRHLDDLETLKADISSIAKATLANANGLVVAQANIAAERRTDIT